MRRRDTYGPLRIRQVFINLLSNAVKFTPPGGRIAVRGKHLAEGVEFTVSDTGIGMSPAEAALAVESFAQVESDLAKSYQGTGLGLPLAKRLVELHGGTLILESIKGRGTSVRITLPSTGLAPAAERPVSAEHAT